MAQISQLCYSVRSDELTQRGLPRWHTRRLAPDICLYERIVGRSNQFGLGLELPDTSGLILTGVAVLMSFSAAEIYVSFTRDRDGHWSKELDVEPFMGATNRRGHCRVHRLAFRNCPDSFARTRIYSNSAGPGNSGNRIRVGQIAPAESARHPGTAYESSPQLIPVESLRNIPRYRL